LRKKFGTVKYKACHPDTLSELAVPILANGQRYGVLNLESSQQDGFNGDHRRVAQNLAQKAGIIVATAEQRRAASACLNDVDELQLAEYFRVHPYLRELFDSTTSRLRYCILRADYVQGTLASREPNPRLTFPFDAKDDRREGAFLRIFIDEQPLLVTRALDGVRHRLVSDICRRALKIDDELFGVPIFSRGHIVGVLACWNQCRDQTQRDGEYRERDAYFKSPIRAASNRVTNLAVLTTGDNQSQALHYLTALHVARDCGSLQGMLIAFMQYQKIADRLRMFRIVQTEHSRRAILIHSVVQSDNLEETFRHSEISVDIDNDKYLDLTFWRSRVRRYATRTPPKLASRDMAAKLGRSRESWYTAPIVTIDAQPLERTLDNDGRVQVETIRAEVKDVVGFIEVDSELADTRKNLGPRQQDRDRLCWALNVLTNLLTERMQASPTKRRHKSHTER
jgi:hypothetical protein